MAEPAYRVLTPEQALALASELGEHSVLYPNRLLAGIDPKLALEDAPPLRARRASVPEGVLAPAVVLRVWLTPLVLCQRAPLGVFRDFR